MIKVMSNLALSCNRDTVQNLQRIKSKHHANDDGTIDLYFPFIWDRKLTKEGGGTLLENLKAQYGEYMDDAIGYGNDVIYTGSIGTGERNLIPVMGDRRYQFVVEMKLNAHNYNELMKRFRMIPLVNSVRNPTMQLVDDMYNGNTLYNEVGIDRHLNNVVQVNWNDMDGIDFKLKCIPEKDIGVNQKYITQIKEIDQLYEVR